MDSTTENRAGGDAPHQAAPEAGWYLLPEDPSQQQYWDGYKWSRGSPYKADKRSRPFEVVRIVVEL